MAGLRERFPFRRVARLVGWNLLILFAGIVLVAGGAEVWLRLTIPFREQTRPVQLVPGVGLLVRPHAEVRRTDGREFWEVSRANGLGFLDRPPSPERAAESCHVTLIGDSFVHASEVPIRAKAQVQLEALAAREARGLDLTASAFGYPGTGQISQLAYYDAYARSLSPDVVALVFVYNDFYENSLLWAVRQWGFSPDHPRHLYARRGPTGEMEFVPPASSLDEMRANLLPRLPARAALGSRVEWKLREWSYLADRLWIRSGHVRRKAAVPAETRLAWMESVGRDARYAALVEGWLESGSGLHATAPLLEEAPLPVYRDMLDVMRFALEQFRERAERDGAALVILASHTVGGAGDALFELLRGLAAGVGGGGGDSRHQPDRPCHCRGRRGWEPALGARSSLERDRPSTGGGGHPRMAEGERGGVRLRRRRAQPPMRAGMMACGTRTSGWRGAGPRARIWPCGTRTSG